MSKTWINKKLRINPGEILEIDTSEMSTRGFDLRTIVSRHGRNDHLCFTLTLPKAYKVAVELYKFATTKQEIEFLRLKQEHSGRGELFLRMFKPSRLDLSIDSFPVNEGQLSLSKKQAKKLAGYMFFWIGESLIGTKRIKKKATSYFVRDINDIMED